MTKIAKPVGTRPAPSRPSTASSVLAFLYERADTSSMTDAELEWLSTMPENVQLMAQNLGSTLAGIASLVYHDMNSEDLRSESFQGDALPELLYGAADVLATIEEMTTIASETNFLLRRRYATRAEQTADLEVTAQAFANAPRSQTSTKKTREPENA